MIKRLALLCCILLLPTIAAAQGTTNYGDFWVGAQVGGVFTPDRDVTVTGPFLNSVRIKVGTDPAVSAGVIVGYNFCMPYKQSWERYFGVALDFQWNTFDQEVTPHLRFSGNQFALSFLGRVQYPLMGDERFTRGRLVPFLMFGPAIVWTDSDFSNVGGSDRTSTDLGIVAEIGLEFFVVPQLSIGPSFRYRHVFGPTFGSHGIKVDSDLDQFMVLGRLAYHF